MSPKWIVFILMAWIVTSMLCGVAENAVIGGAIDPETGDPIQTSVLNDLAQSKVLTAPTLGAKISAAFTDGAFWSALAHIIAFQFPAIFHGSWIIFQWVFFLPFVIAFGVCMMGYIMSHIPVIGRGS